jgi:hypothetical protein
MWELNLKQQPVFFYPLVIKHGSETWQWFAAGKIIKLTEGFSSNSRYHINQVSPIKHLAATLSHLLGYRMSLRKTPEELGKVRNIRWMVAKSCSS